MAAVSLSLGKLAVLIAIAILASSAISIGASMILAVGPQGPQGPQGEPGVGLQPAGYISIPASAFVSSYNTDNNYIGRFVENKDNTNFTTLFGSVQLPHGATITNVTSYWYDGNTSWDIICLLIRLTPTGGYDLILADVRSSGSAGYGSSVTPISHDINNRDFTYTISLQMPPYSPSAGTQFLFATIGFAYLT